MFDELDDAEDLRPDPTRQERVLARAGRRRARRRAVGMALALTAFAAPLGLALNRDRGRDGVRLATEPGLGLTTTSTETATSPVLPDPAPDIDPQLPPSRPPVTVVSPPGFGPPTSAGIPGAVTATTSLGNPGGPTTTSPPETVRRPVLADRGGRWQLLSVGQGASRCLELVAGSRVHGSLLCGSGPTTAVVGDLVALETAIGRMVVAVASPTVTGFDAYSQAAGGREPNSGQAAADPLGVAGLAYVAGTVGGGGAPSELVMAAGEQTPAKVIVPVADGAFRAAELKVKTSAPYGVWPGYRRAGLTGFVFAGNQEVGFYDGPGGVRCLLYRRFTGPAERLLADQCPAPPGPQPPFAAYAELLPAGVANFERVYLPALVTDLRVTGWRCELSTGATCGSAQVHADPKGSGRTFLYSFAGLFQLPPGATLTAVLLDGQTEVGRVELRAP